MKKIYLSGKNKDKYAIVDDKDFPILSQWKWYDNNRGYASSVRQINGKTKNFLMHHEILKPPSGLLIDHINGNKLDNQRKNLRIADKSMNAINGFKKSKNIYKGINYQKHRKNWRAVITVKNKFY